MKAFLVKINDDEITAAELKEIIFDGMAYGTCRVPTDHNVTVEDSVCYQHQVDKGLDDAITDELAHPPKNIVK